MKCPRCKSTQISKNGHHHGKQNYICKQCRRQFVEFYGPKGYSNDVKQICLRMYVNGMGFRGIELLSGIHHNTVINWVRENGLSLPDAPESEEIPEITELDELQTFIGKKKNKVWLWTAVNKMSGGILAWVVGDRSAKTFENLGFVKRFVSSMKIKQEIGLQKRSQIDSKRPSNPELASSTF